MGQNLLTYETVDARPRSWKGGRGPLGLVGVVLGAMALVFVEVGDSENRIDAVTGSTSSRINWRIGISSTPKRNVSALESRLARAGIAWKADWRF